MRIRQPCLMLGKFPLWAVYTIIHKKVEMGIAVNHVTSGLPGTHVPLLCMLAHTSHGSLSLLDLQPGVCFLLFQLEQVSPRTLSMGFCVGENLGVFPSAVRPPCCRIFHPHRSGCGLYPVKWFVLSICLASSFPFTKGYDHSNLFQKNGGGREQEQHHELKMRMLRRSSRRAAKKTLCFLIAQ